MHHGASAYAYQHGRHQNDKHAQHGIGDIQSGPDPAWREKSDYCQQCDDDTQSQSDPSGVAACHGHVFDGTHIREGLRGDGDQRTQNNLRYRGEQFSWHGSSSRKANIADYRNKCSERKDLFFHSIRVMSPQRRRHEGRLLEKPSELFNRRHTKQQSFDAIRAEIDGDHRIRALVLRFDDLSQTVMVMGDSVAYLEIRNAQSVVAVQRTCRSRFRQILWLGAARGDLTGFAGGLAGTV